MKVFNPRHFLRHISMPTLREFADAHVLAPRLRIDWTVAEETLPSGVCDAVDELWTALAAGGMTAEERKAAEHDLLLWFDDLRRAHLMSNDLAIKEFLSACRADPAVVAAFSSRDVKERALWMLMHQADAFRDAELHLAFLAKTNGRYWKKYRIQAGLDPTRDRLKLEAFAGEVAKLYKKDGYGDSTHIEVSQDRIDGSVQLTLYVEGPITALAHFSDKSFERMTTRIALEAALVYQPSTGLVETVVKGGGKLHLAVLKLFGSHVVDEDIDPQEIEHTVYRLNELRDGVMTPAEDWSIHGVDMVRLRRAQFAPMDSTGIAFGVEASPDKRQPDAMRLARDNFKVNHAFETEYDLASATVIVYTLPGERRRPHFSFNLHAAGSSTIKNLSPQNQATALAVLRLLDVIDGEEAGA